MKYTFILAVIICAFLLIWPLVRTLAILIAVAGCIFIIFVWKDSKKIKKEMTEKPEEFFNSQKEEK